MLNSNATCLINKRVGFDMYGKAQMGIGVSERCAVIKLLNEQRRTLPRAENSQSRGHAEEFATMSDILLDAKTVAVIDDKLTVHGHSIKLTSMRERYDVNGDIDHYECTGELWA